MIITLSREQLAAARERLQRAILAADEKEAAMQLLAALEKTGAVGGYVHATVNGGRLPVIIKLT